MRYEGFIFDLDGVICHTDEYHYQAWQALASKLGIPFSRAINSRLRGVSRMESLEIMLEKSTRSYTPEEKIAFADEKNRTYQALLVQMSPKDLSDDVRGTLLALRRRGLCLAIGSSSKNTPLILERIGLGDFFDAVSDGNNITRSKPDPEVFQKAADRLSLPAKSCVVVEDAHAGVEAAHCGGFSCAAMGDAKDDPLAQYHLERFGDCLKIIESTQP